MLPISKLKDARKGAKVTKREAAKVINRHQDTVTRIEDGDILPQLEDMARAYGFNICLLSPAECAILQGIELKIAENEQK
jgi:DNA-binding XRE family transcriptional regulator